MHGNDHFKTTLSNMINNDPTIMDALKKVRALDLPNGYIAAGFIRNFVWDMKHGYEQRTPLNDVDVIYYDPSDIRETTEKQYEQLLREMDSSLPWSVKNEARMHIKNNDEPYQSVEDALKHWAETPTAVGVRFKDDGHLNIVAPFGLEDLFGLVLREGPFVADKSAFQRRYTEKRWLQIWPKLKLVESKDVGWLEKWKGSSAVCINDNGKLLMVLQGQPEEEKLWSIPSGGKEAGESFEDCCVREVREETGYEVKILNKLHEKEGESFGIDVKVQYFEVELTGGNAAIQDPDELIHDIQWKSADDIQSLNLSFPEDRSFLIEFIKDNN